MTEDVARTLAIASALGKLRPMPPEEIETWYDRYHNRYGQ